MEGKKHVTAVRPLSAAVQSFEPSIPVEILELLPCKKHYRRLKSAAEVSADLSNEQQESTGSWAPEQPTQRYLRQLTLGEVRGACLCDYIDYPKLLAERQMRDRAVQKPFRLRDLPAELRSDIFEHVLTAEAGLEFCPEPWDFNGAFPVPYDQGREVFNGTWGQVIQEHETRLLGHAATANALLRLSRQMNREMSSMLDRVFYGNSEFRFTNSSGWVALEFFMFRIGMPNCRHLTQLTVRHPSASILPVTCNGHDFFQFSIVRLQQPRFDADGIFYPERWEKLPLTDDPRLVLEKAKALKRLRVVVPWKTEDVRELSSCPVDESKFANLVVTYLSLVSEAEAGCEGYEPGTSAACAIVAAHNSDSESKWLYEERIYDGVGHYGPLLLP